MHFGHPSQEAPAKPAAAFGVRQCSGALWWCRYRGGSCSIAGHRSAPPRRSAPAKAPEHWRTPKPRGNRGALRLVGAFCAKCMTCSKRKRKNRTLFLADEIVGNTSRRSAEGGHTPPLFRSLPCGPVGLTRYSRQTGMVSQANSLCRASHPRPLRQSALAPLRV